MIMKNLSFLICLLVISSCAKEQITAEQEPIQIQRVEEYAHGVQKELVMTRSGITVEVLDSVYILEGDGLISKEQFDMLEQPDLLEQTATRGAILTANNYIWPDGIVYFHFYAGSSGRRDPAKCMTTEERQIVYDAMNEFHTCTGVEFRPVTYKPVGTASVIEQRDYIEFENTLGDAASYVGKQGGKQIIYLDMRWVTKGIAMHEICHALGLLHEQCRKDRDDAIIVNYDNIQPSGRHNFDKSNLSHVYTGYQVDFKSLMLYGSYNEYAINREVPCMTKKDGSTWNANRYYLSTDDKIAINHKYKRYPYCGIVLQNNQYP